MQFSLDFIISEEGLVAWVSHCQGIPVLQQCGPGLKQPGERRGGEREGGKEGAGERGRMGGVKVRARKMERGGEGECERERGSIENNRGI